MKRQLINRAKRLTAAAAKPTFTDTITVRRDGVFIRTIRGRLVYTGRTESNDNYLLGLRIMQFCELHISNDEIPPKRGDSITVEESENPAMAGRVGRVTYNDPVMSISGFQRIIVAIDGTFLPQVPEDAGE